MSMRKNSSRKCQRGYLIMEALITIVLLLLALLGMAGLHSRAYQAETESYQRVQALTLVRDMVNRITANRSFAVNYVTGTTAGSQMGAGSGKDCSGPVTVADIDLCQWHAALIGAAEAAGGACNTATGANCVGAMINARGCITAIAGSAPPAYLVQVVWQGFTPTTAPPNSVACGTNAYGDEKLRRAVTAPVSLADLTG
jgi:type IV pilus assembly protein PilV